MKPASGARKAGIKDSAVLVRIQSNWLSNVIHDLANPLFAARGYLRMMLEEKKHPLTDTQHHWLVTALENIDKLTALTRELNDLPGKNGLELDIINLRDLLRQVLGDAQKTLSGHVQLTPEVPDGSLATIGDPEKLAGALQGFVRVAIETARPAGIVQIRACEENEKILLQFWASPGSADEQKKPAPDVSEASKVWRLHGGNCSVSKIAEGGYMINCELPVVRLQEC
jgi:signal transduction histidine kinase